MQFGRTSAKPLGRVRHRIDVSGMQFGRTSAKPLGRVRHRIDVSGMQFGRTSAKPLGRVRHRIDVSGMQFNVGYAVYNSVNEFGWTRKAHEDGRPTPR